jgi:hypothetical protein
MVEEIFSFSYLKHMSELNIKFVIVSWLKSVVIQVDYRNLQEVLGLTVSCIQSLFLTGVKRLGGGGWSAEVKNQWSYVHITSVRLHGFDSDRFIVWLLFFNPITKRLTYASETSTLTKRDRKQLNIFERKVYRRILGPVYDNEKENCKILTNKEIYSIVKNLP